MKVTVQSNQSLVDIAVQEHGSNWLSGMLQMIELNQVSQAEELEVGQELEVGTVDENDLSLQYLKSREIMVASGIFESPLPAAPSNLTGEIC